VNLVLVVCVSQIGGIRGVRTSLALRVAIETVCNNVQTMKHHASCMLVASKSASATVSATDISFVMTICCFESF
jgi:hypothetical protein